MFEIGLQLRYEVLNHIYLDHANNIGKNSINSTITQHDYYDYTIAIDDFLINSLPILILGLLISIVSILLEFIYHRSFIPQSPEYKPQGIQLNNMGPWVPNVGSFLAIEKPLYNRPYEF